MTRIAIFVEGQTELIFIDRLVRHLAQEKGLAIEHAEATGGAHRARRVNILKRPRPSDAHEVYVMIVNCGGDSMVKSDILERYHGLAQAGYCCVIGLRDVYGQFRYEDVTRLRGTLLLQLPSKPIPIEFILSIMEVEAWFLAEYTHLARIDPRLTPEYIEKRLGFNPATDDIERRHHPAEDLDHAYQLAGIHYSKKRDAVTRTIDNLDLDFYIKTLSTKFWDIRRLLELLDHWL